MIDSSCLDSSIWIAYFINGDYKEIIEGKKENVTSVLSLIEVYNRLIKMNVPESEVSKKVESMKTLSQIKEITIEIAEEARDCVRKDKLNISDAIVYATAKKTEKKLLTLDNDFRGLPNAKVL